MRRLAAILLVGTLFFNWYGYQLLTQYWQQRSDRRLEARFDRDEYDESLLICLKIPITALAYYRSSCEFQRVDGQIVIGGVHYKYVKRRIFGDSLELLCIANEAAMRLQKVSGDFFRHVNDLQHRAFGKRTDYQETAIQVAVADLLRELPARGGYVLPCYTSCYARMDDMPPDGAHVFF